MHYYIRPIYGCPECIFSPSYITHLPQEIQTDKIIAVVSSIGISQSTWFFEAVKADDNHHVCNCWHAGTKHSVWHTTDLSIEYYA